MIARRSSVGFRNWPWIPVAAAGLALAVVVVLQVNGVEISPAIVVGFGAAIGTLWPRNVDAQTWATKSERVRRSARRLEIAASAWLTSLLLGLGLTLPALLDLLWHSEVRDRAALTWGLSLLGVSVFLLAAGGVAAAVLVGRRRRDRVAGAEPGDRSVDAPPDRRLGR